MTGKIEDLVLRAWGRGIRIDRADHPEEHGKALVDLLFEARGIDKVHPWHEFLRARMHCLAWLRDEMGETPEQSAITMVMDPQQVSLLLDTYDKHVKAPEPAPECTCTETVILTDDDEISSSYDDPDCPRHGSH